MFCCLLVLFRVLLCVDCFDCNIDVCASVVNSDALLFGFAMGILFRLVCLFVVVRVGTFNVGLGVVCFVDCLLDYCIDCY